MKNTINEVSSCNKNMRIKAILNTVLLFVAVLTTVIPEGAIAGKNTADNTRAKLGGVKSNISPEVKKLSGISIIGNKEAPKSLYIVPWQNSEVGVASGFKSGLLDDSMRPVDKEVFLRELDFYRLSHGSKY